MNKELDPNKGPIDFSNTKQLVDDIWLFLTDKPLGQQATIKRETFDHEVGAMIDKVREYERDMTLKSLSVMSPEQFQQFLDIRFQHAAIQAQLHKDELERLTKPGDIIIERLKTKGIHLLDFALDMSRLPEEINDIISGTTPINQVIAQQLEQALGVEAQFWLNMEALYREKLQKLRFAKLKP